ncbi:MAG: threonylcarbamoyl-AMP synthase [Saprospiraceae bacterium]|nr:threonylcarbamoyl-AMP synthase [Saprospiraceae bacterium]
MQTIIGKDVVKSAQLLREGNVIAIPTETVYGLAGNALNSKVVSQIFNIKGRPITNPLILHVNSVDQAKLYSSEWPEWAEILSMEFWPGPLTLLLKKTGLINDQLTSGSDRVAIRIPAHSMTRELLSMLDFPLAAPSANPFTYISPTTAEHVLKQLGGKIPYILDGGPCKKGLESTIVGMEEGQIYIYREGAVTAEQISKWLGPIKIKVKNDEDKSTEAPGMLQKHYSPYTRLLVTEDAISWKELGHEKKLGFVLYNSPAYLFEEFPCVVLSHTKDPDEAASNLYAALHALDAMGLDLIIAELMPAEGIGRAINDRLRRAANS